MKKKQGLENTRRLFWNEMNKHFKGKVPLIFRFNIWLFRLLLPKRCCFMMQQIVIGYAYQIAFKRSIEWSKQQIIIWQKERS